MRKLLYIFLVLSIVSCKDKEIDFEGAVAEPVIALSAFFTPTEPFCVELTSTQSILGDQSVKKILTDGSITIYDGDKIVEKIIYNPSKRKYIGYLKPSEKKTYTIKASVKNFKPVIADVYIPEAVEITNIVLSEYNSNNDDMDSGIDGDTKASISFKLPKENSINYYMIVMYACGVDTQGYISESKTPIAISSKDITLAGADSVESVFKDSEYKNKFNIFNDELFDEEISTLDVIFSSYEVIYTVNTNSNDRLDNEYLVDANIKVNIQSISEDYYKFLKSYENQLDSGDSPFTEPYQLWTNVEDGTGVAAGYSISEKSAQIENAELISDMFIEDQKVNYKSFPLGHTVNKSTANIEISTYEAFDISVYANGVYLKDTGIDKNYFSGEVENLKIGENKLRIRFKSENGADIFYDFIITRTE